MMPPWAAVSFCLDKNNHTCHSGPHLILNQNRQHWFKSSSIRFIIEENQEEHCDLSHEWGTGVRELVAWQVRDTHLLAKEGALTDIQTSFCCDERRAKQYPYSISDSYSIRNSGL
jgi:hypothetical protein